MENLKIGDVVWLKTGSEAMAITKIHEDNCHVVWHDSNSNEKTGRYPLAILTKDNPNSNPPPPTAFSFG